MPYIFVFLFSELYTIIDVRLFLSPVLGWCPRRAMLLAETQQTEGRRRAKVSDTRQPDGHRLSMYKMQSTVAGGSFTLHCVYKLHISLAIKTYFHRFVTVGWLVFAGLNPEEASSSFLKRRQTGYSSKFPSQAFIWQLIFLLRTEEKKMHALLLFFPFPLI